MNIKAFEALGEYMDLLLDAICVVNPQDEFVYLSAGAKRVFGYDPQEMLGRSMYEFMHPDDYQITRGAVVEIMQGREKTNFENRYVRKNGETVVILWSARYSPEQNLRIAVARDVTEQRRVEREREKLLDELQRMALYDHLTSLPNRSYFYSRFEQAVQEEPLLGVLYLDLNGFKQINDSLGHAIGDEVLVDAGQRIGATLRNSDTVARMGGDEFVVLAEKVRSADDAVFVAGKIQSMFEAPFVVGGERHHVHLSIGVALWPVHGGTVQEVLRRADEAMYQAKQRPGSAIVVAPPPADLTA